LADGAGQVARRSSPPQSNRLDVYRVEPDETYQASAAPPAVPSAFQLPQTEPPPSHLSHALSDEFTPALSSDTKITPDTDPNDAVEVLKLRIDYFENRHELDKIAFEEERKDQKDHPANNPAEVTAQRAKIKKLSTRKSASKRAVIRDKARLTDYLLKIENAPSVEMMKAQVQSIIDEVNFEINNVAVNPSVDPAVLQSRKILMSQLISKLTKAQFTLRKSEAQLASRAAADGE
jgi:hypothetical protein